MRMTAFIAAVSLVLGSPHLLCAENPLPAAAPATVGSKLTALNKEGTVLLDTERKRLILKADVCLREGLLEMLACLKQTKEHEAILRVDARAQVVHAGLLALGAESGRPVQFMPEYKPATGQPIEIFLSWTDKEGKSHREPAQKWIRNATRKYFVEKLDQLPDDVPVGERTDLRYDEKNKELFWYGQMSAEQRDQWLKPTKDAAYRKAVQSIFNRTQLRQLDARWVFAGSGFTVDEKTGKKFYNAESGDLICVANFSTATLDLAVSSSASNDGLDYEAWTERIPPVGTPVEIELIPVFAKNPETAPK
jgi:hypothetical protein